ncbi:MAG TPA: hypothetical protein VHY18_02825 [Solirubrobacteraceae bacterium]|jgi:hypothetical protein|nr:hypothetical protein [Solirubrobacteraceae bacterium]
MKAKGSGSVSQLSIASLLEAAGIERVICVDDVYAATVETFLQTLSGLKPAQRALVFGEQADQFEEDEVWQIRVRELWEELDKPERASLVDKAYAIEGGAKPPGIGAIHALGVQLPEEIDSDGMSLDEWRARSAELIEQSESKTTLILFDQDFHHEGGSDKEGQRAIEQLESKLNTLEKCGNVYYGLLTNTVELDEESEKREQIVKESKVDPARLVVISKRNLDEEDHDLERFAQRLRLTLLAPIYAQLIERVTAERMDIQKGAIEKFREIAAEEMEHMVVRSSDREGDWPPDTLIRILEALERADIRKRLRTDRPVGELTERLLRIAAIAPPPTPDAPQEAVSTASEPIKPSTAKLKPPLSTAAKILHAENYDDAKHVNELHLPIELGDLIEGPTNKANKGLWVVVAQPCTLMVRGKGDRKPELTHMTLVKVEQQSADASADAADLFELPYYLLAGDKIAVARLSRAAYVRSIVLDSCVLNEDGQAKLDLDAEPSRGLLPHWRMRAGHMKKFGKALLEHGEDANVQLPDDLILDYYKPDPFAPKIDRDARIIEWNCRRVGRVGNPYARALLTRFSQYSAREAYLNDLARQ